MLEVQRENKNILKWVGPRRDLYFLEFIYLFCSSIRVCFKLYAFVREHVWPKAFLMGYSMKLELTLNGFELVMGFFMNVVPFFFLECVSLSLLYPSFAFDISYVVCVCVCVCVLEWFQISLIVIFSVCECVLRFILCVSVYIYIYIYIYICVCVCMFVSICACVYDSCFIQLWFKFIYKILFLYLK